MLVIIKDKLTEHPWEGGAASKIEAYGSVVPPLSYLTASVYNVVLQKSIPAQIRQLILDVSNDKGWVDGAPLGGRGCFENRGVWERGALPALLLLYVLLSSLELSDTQVCEP